jgi:HEAT repeat protein
MKRVIAGMVAMVLIASMAQAANRLEIQPPERYAKAEANLLSALASDNAGLRESAAYMLGEMGSTKAVVPLMRMLHDSETESARIVAALALCRIGDGRGVYAVRRAAQFDDSYSVQALCAWFHEQYTQGGAFEFVGERAAVAPAVAAR